MKKSLLICLICMLTTGFATMAYASDGEQDPIECYSSNQALEAISNGSLQDILLETNETRIIEFPDGSAVKVWITDGESSIANGQVNRDPPGSIYNGSKTASASIRDAETGDYGVTLKLKVDYQYGDHYLKVTAFDAWAESEWGYQLVFDYSHASVTSSSSEATATGYYNVKYEYIQAGQTYTISPALSMKLICGAFTVSVDAMDFQTVN